MIETLYDAADDDSATGGPDLTRGIFPVVMLATAGGITRVPDDVLAHQPAVQHVAIIQERPQLLGDRA